MSSDFVGDSGVIALGLVVGDVAELEPHAVAVVGGAVGVTGLYVHVSLHLLFFFSFCRG